MKAPNLTDIGKKRTGHVAVKEEQETFKNEAIKQAIEADKQANKKVRRTFTLTQEDSDFIDTLSLHLGNERGKSVSASEALRLIVSQRKKGML